jgi:hypothetical protein
MFSRVSRLRTMRKLEAAFDIARLVVGLFPGKVLSRTCYVLGGGFVIVSTRNQKTLQM